MDAESLKAYAKQVGADYDALTDPSNPQAILINQMDYFKRSQAAKLSFLTKKPGETVSFCITVCGKGTRQQTEKLRRKIWWTSLWHLLTDQVPMGVNSMTTSPTDVVMIVSQEVFDEILRKIPDIPDTLTGQTEDDRIARSSLNAQFYATSDDDKAVSQNCRRFWIPTVNKPVWVEACITSAARQKAWIRNAFDDEYLRLWLYHVDQPHWHRQYFQYHFHRAGSAETGIRHAQIDWYVT